MVHPITVPGAVSISTISPFFAPLKEKVLTFMVENKYLEMIANFVLWQMASKVDYKLIENKRKVRIAFVLYLSLYTLYLIYSSVTILEQNDMRSIKLTNPILDFGKRAMGGNVFGGNQEKTVEGEGEGNSVSSFSSLLTNGLMGQKLTEHMQSETTVRDYDLSIISSSFNKMLFYSIAMYIAHVYFNRLSSWIYHASLMAPLTTIREPIFQLHILKMPERGPRLRPFKPPASSNIFETMTKAMNKNKDNAEENEEENTRETESQINIQTEGGKDIGLETDAEMESIPNES